MRIFGVDRWVSPFALQAFLSIKVRANAVIEEVEAWWAARFYSTLQDSLRQKLQWFNTSDNLSQYRLVFLLALSFPLPLSLFFLPGSASRLLQSVIFDAHEEEFPRNKRPNRSALPEAEIKLQAKLQIKVPT